MAIYHVHRLHGANHNFDLNGHPCVGDFAGDELLRPLDQHGPAVSPQPFDALRTTIGKIAIDTPGRRKGGTLFITIVNNEYPFSTFPVPLIYQTVRWVERLQHVLILHNTTPPPIMLDGTLLCFKCTAEELGHLRYQPLGTVGESLGNAVEQVNNETTLVSFLGDMRLSQEASPPYPAPDKGIPAKPLYCAFRDGTIAKFVEVPDRIS